MVPQKPVNPVVAFYAPMKPPTHGNPSGDRRIARLFMQALSQAGYQVQLASIFRSLDINGNSQRQEQLKCIGQKIANRLIKRYKKLPVDQQPSFWFTYHLYHKAPDWLGPAVSDALKIPYILAEASYSPKQRNGRWHSGLQASEVALRKADHIFSVNPADIACIKTQAPDAKVSSLPIFLESDAFPNDVAEREKISREYAIDPGLRWLICIAMMRPGDKEASYKILADALKTSTSKNWRLLVVGDGTASKSVNTFFEGIPGIHFLGKLESEKIRELLSACDLFVWPAVNEALGMALLEAQACGTPVLAGHEGGVASIVAENESAVLVEPRNADAFSKALDELLSNNSKLRTMGLAARRYTEKNHSLLSASRHIQTALLDIPK